MRVFRGFFVYHIVALVGCLQSYIVHFKHVELCRVPNSTFSKHVSTNLAYRGGCNFRSTCRESCFPPTPPPIYMPGELFHSEPPLIYMPGELFPSDLPPDLHAGRAVSLSAPPDLHAGRAVSLRPSPRSTCREGCFFYFLCFFYYAL